MILIRANDSHHHVRVGYDSTWLAPTVQLDDVTYFLDYGADSGNPFLIGPIMLWRVEQDPETIAMPHVARVLDDAWQQYSPFIDLVPN